MTAGPGEIRPGRFASKRIKGGAEATTYVMSDIHGMKNLYDAMLSEINFSKDDTLYVIGDAIDRGPDGIAMLQDLMSRRNAVFLLGNHERMMLDAVNPFGPYDAVAIWANNGSTPTVKAWNKLNPMQKTKLTLFLKRAPEYLDIQVNGQAYHLVHACPGNDSSTRLWTRPNPYGIPRYKDRRVIVGHTPVMNFHPSSSGYLATAPGHMEIYKCESFIGIDCGSGMPWYIPKRALACLRLDDMAEFYQPM